jgi:hypothetical protein
MDHEHHGGHGAQGGDHSPATGQLSPNEPASTPSPTSTAARPAATRGTAPTAGTGTMPRSSGTGSGGAWP